MIIVGGFAALGLIGCPQTGIGDPCTPEDEFKEGFPGFTLQSAFIESRSFQCQTRLCLVNHFQGRSSCPRGQAQPRVCNDDAGVCDKANDESCKFAGVILENCDPTPCTANGANPANCNGQGGKNVACGGNVCDPDGRFCQCTAGQCPDRYFCDSGKGKSNLCTTKVCSVSPTSQHAADHCFVPGTDIPVAVAVCGQCDQNSKRNADAAVYCTCRCAPPADNASAADDNFNFCTCPKGFDCVELNPNVGLGDAQLAGSYCIRQGTKYVEQEVNCGSVNGYVGKDANCQGTQK